MTTATIQAPTEEEIRAAVHEGTASWPSDLTRFSPVDPVTDVLRDIFFGAADVFDAIVWNAEDFRPSEQAAFDEIVARHITVATEAAMARVVEEVTAAGIEFAAVCPEAPRKAVEA